MIDWLIETEVLLLSSEYAYLSRVRDIDVAIPSSRTEGLWLFGNRYCVTTAEHVTAGLLHHTSFL